MNQSLFPAIVSFIALAASFVGRVSADFLAARYIKPDSAASEAVHARVNFQPARLPVLDAHDVRFVSLPATLGLWQTGIRQIVQDDEGFVWIGTQHGLNRYDGYKLKVLIHDATNSNSPSGVHMASLFKDHAGFLWIGTDQALDRLDPRTETFTHYHLQAAGLGAQPAAVVDSREDRDGAIWLATRTGLFRLDLANGTMRLFQHDATDPHSLSSSDVKSTFEDSKRRFWVANSAGLDQFDRATGKVRVHVPLESPIREFLVYEDRYGLLWLGYASGGGAGLATFDPETNVLRPYTFASKDIPGGVYTGVYAITEDRAGDLWIGTGGMGLLRLDRSNNRFLRYRNTPEDSESLANDHVTALHLDSEGNVWVGLHAKEPSIIASRPRLFRHVIRSFGGHGGGELLVSSIFQDRHGILWIGSSGGLNRLDRQSGVPTFIPTAERGVSAGVLAILEDPSGDLWLGTVGQGLKRFDPRTGKVVKTYIHEADNPSSLSDDMVGELRFAGPGKLWISTWDGLDQLDVATGRFTVYKPDSHQRTEPYGRFAQDKNANLWIASGNGLTRFNPGNSDFAIFRHVEQPTAISSNGVTGAFVDSHDRLWVSTEDGLDKLNADGSFTTYRQQDGLGGNAMSCILEDDVGSLWLSTNKGISRFDPGSQVFANYSAEDGLGDLTGWGACFRSPGGEMLFGGLTGLVAFYPNKIVDVPSHAPIRLTDLRINGEAMQIGATGPLNRSVLDTTAQITLSPDQKNFSLEFASLNYLDALATRYRYRMDGLDSRWNEVGSDQRVVSYTSLPAGTYLFRAQAAVGRGSWTEPGVALRVHVLPPWWKSWWFTIALGVVGILLVWVGYSYRLRAIARQFDMRLEERVTERTRIARELHDSLLQGFQGMIFRLQAVLELMPGRPSDARQELERALEVGDKAIAEGREAVRDLRASAAAATDLEDSLRALGDELDSRHGGASYRVMAQGKPRAISPRVRDDVYRIAREAFRNAVRHACARNIETELEYGDATFRLRVRDDGVGVAREVLGRGNREGHWGLPGMRERAEAIGGHLEIWSENAVGTEVDLAIPAGIAYGRRLARRE